MSTAPVDWRKVLVAYMRHVNDWESITFLGYIYGTPNDLSDEETKALLEIEAEVDPKSKPQGETE